MSESTSSSVAGDAAGDIPEGLTAERIEATLADFRAWLYELAAADAPPTEPNRQADPVDLHTILAQFVALRHEVNLQTKAVRSQQEQNAETLQLLGQSLDALNQGQGSSAPAGPETDDDEFLRPLLKTLVDVADALGLARRELQRSRQAASASLEALIPANDRPEGISDLLHRLVDAFFGRRRKREQPQQAAQRVTHLLDGLIAGYTMSVQRIERALQQHGLEPIPCRGESFDPERMEVVEAVAGSGRPPGEVIEEARPGYLWNGRVFRYAQVRVAK